MKRNFSISTSGSITTITAKTTKALNWLKSNLYTESWQWTGNTVAIDSRFEGDITEAISLDF